MTIQLPDTDIYVSWGKKAPIGKPSWGNMLSVVEGAMAPVPWEQ